MKNIYKFILFLPVILSGSCSHKFDADVQNLNFYQWNLWQDAGAGPDEVLPSCGWEDLHRGMGKLVRIPAPLDEYFAGIEAPAVYWYHCRFSLPEKWQDLPISLAFESASPIIRVYLNEEEVGLFRMEEGAFEVDVSDYIYYIRDNHLSIRVSIPDGESPEKPAGITGTILVKPDLGSVELENNSE